MHCVSVLVCRFSIRVSWRERQTPYTTYGLDFLLLLNRSIFVLRVVFILIGFPLLEPEREREDSHVLSIHDFFSSVA